MKRGTKETNYSDYTSSSRTFPAPSSLTRSSPALDSIGGNLSTLRKQRIKTAALQREAGDSRSCLGIFDSCGVVCCGAVFENRRVLPKPPCHGAVTQPVRECTERADSPGLVLFWERDVPSNRGGGSSRCLLLTLLKPQKHTSLG